LTYSPASARFRHGRRGLSRQQHVVVHTQEIWIDIDVADGELLHPIWQPNLRHQNATVEWHHSLCSNADNCGVGCKCLCHTVADARCKRFRAADHHQIVAVKTRGPARHNRFARIPRWSRCQARLRSQIATPPMWCAECPTPLRPRRSSQIEVATSQGKSVSIQASMRI
jgi:hypothetical protein